MINGMPSPLANPIKIEPTIAPIHPPTINKSKYPINPIANKKDNRLKIITVSSLTKIKTKIPPITDTKDTRPSHIGN